MKPITNIHLPFAIFSLIGVMAIAYFGTKNLVGQAITSTRRVPLTVSYLYLDKVGNEQSSATIHYRSDGSQSLTTTTPSALHSRREYRDVKTGWFVSIEPANGTFLRLPLSAQSASRVKVAALCEMALRSAPEDTVRCEPPSKIFLGYPVARAVVIGVNGHGAERVEEVWAVPELNWLAVERSVTVGGEFAGHSKATALQAGEPDESFFTVPKEFQEISTPSVFLLRSKQARGIPSDNIRPGALEKVDAQAEKARVAGPLGNF